MLIQRPQRLYTLDEAKKELAKEECERRGHYFQVRIDRHNVPTTLSCSRCGSEWTVSP